MAGTKEATSPSKRLRARSRASAENREDDIESRLRHLGTSQDNREGGYGQKRRKNGRNRGAVLPSLAHRFLCTILFSHLSRKALPVSRNMREASWGNEVSPTPSGSGPRGHEWVSSMRARERGFQGQ